MHESVSSGLNPEQLEAVTTVDGPVLIIAGAGSGKTKMITHRIAEMLKRGISPSSILALTFTNKAAQEMTERIRSLTGKKLARLTTSTFHAFGMSILKRHIRALGYRPDFTVYDQQDVIGLLKNAAAELHMDIHELDLFTVTGLFSSIKTGRVAWSHDQGKLKKLFDEYVYLLRLFNAVDFDDLIMMPIWLFKERPDILKEYRTRYTYIMVDEFQDTSLAQYEFVSLLASEHRNICVVGDDDQSIYSWRGANYENIMKFERDFPERREIKLERNYRSTGTILKAANSLIANNSVRKEKTLWTGEEAGNRITISYPDNGQEEASWIANKIREIKILERGSYDDFGVLVRTNSLLATIEQEFMAERIPYSISGGHSFFQRKEIKDIIAYMRVLVNHDDEVNLLRIINTPRRGIGKITIERIRDLAEETRVPIFSSLKRVAEDDDAHLRSVARDHVREFLDLILDLSQRIRKRGRIAQTVSELIHEIHYRAYLVGEHPDNEQTAIWKQKNVDVFISMISTWEHDPDNADASVFDFLNRISLSGKHEPERNQGTVSLMTIHASKGLEFQNVFLAGVEDHIIPHARSIEESESNIEEERRLFYVALTRARRRLYITSCRQRRILQDAIVTSPSRFLKEIPRDLITDQDEPDGIPDEVTTDDLFAALRARLGQI